MKMSICWCCVLFLISIFVGNVQAETCSLASYYSSHMVLQQQPQNAILWGYTDDQAAVQVRVQDKMYKAQTGFKPFSTTAIWKVKLDPMPAGGPYNITVFCQAFTVVNTIYLVDVMFGDVWVCSGQSNMAFTVKQAFNGSKELIDSVTYPNIRLLAVVNVTSATPEYDFNGGLHGPWSKPNSDSLGGKAPTYTYFSALCWFFGRDLYDSLQYPIGLISSNWGSTPIEVWSAPNVLQHCNATESIEGLLEIDEELESLLGRDPKIPTCLWNSMIHPMLNFTIKGVIWYQGEANTGDPAPYKCLFHAMIEDWRLKWNEGTDGSTDPQFPFGFMQLSTSNYPYPETVGPYPTLRWHQTYDYGYVPNPVMKNVFMAVGIDLVDETSPYGPIHPRDKQEMGTRLSLAGRAVVYGQNVTSSGPFPSEFTVDPETLTVLIKYDNGNANIRIVGKIGFEICCSGNAVCQSNDTSWVPAEVISQPTPSSLIVSYYCYKKQAVSIRYLWRDMPCTFKGCPVYSVENNLPGAPFVATLQMIGGGSFTYTLTFPKILIGLTVTFFFISLVEGNNE
ncbi:sialate O-acetylesterase-like [Asterias rubens]|uniref:sialate O-acetylesterase-like n=1 Tax=Asterias rubens TaxID=7604 RepID=UPI001455C341|nr:sialate O-acetylesterase-like [Asterias rubens]XP_033626190.1 sialate O-acetylesterase-like [Asterias rubens]XP_033626191.1 sialate O-acetylesterase-like [Asterias rubens]